MAEAEDLKLWCAVRTDIAIPAGKFGTQCGHGYCNTLVAAMHQRPEVVEAYFDGAQAKITVQAKNAEALQRIHREAAAVGIPTALITDAGRTVFAEPTLTVCGFGPAKLSELPAYLRRLQLYPDRFPNPAEERAAEALDAANRLRIRPVCPSCALGSLDTYTNCDQAAGIAASVTYGCGHAFMGGTLREALR